MTTHDLRLARSELLKGKYVVADPVLWVPPTDIAIPTQTEVRYFEAAKDGMVDVMHVQLQSVHCKINIPKIEYHPVGSLNSITRALDQRTFSVEGYLGINSFDFDGVEELSHLEDGDTIEMYFKIRKGNPDPEGLMKRFGME